MNLPNRSPLLHQFGRLLILLPLLAPLPACLAQTIPPSSSNAILEHLNAAIGLYRHTTTTVGSTGQPSDAIYQSNAQNMTSQAVRLAFQSAKAEAALMPASPSPGTSGTSASASPPHVSQSLENVNSRVDTLQSQISVLDAKIAKAPASRIQKLTAQRNALAGMLDLSKTMQSALQQMVKYSSQDDHASSLESNIDQLERAVPEISGTGVAVPKPASPRASSGPRGLLGNVFGIYDQLEAMHQINLLIAETERVQATAVSLRKPLQAALRATIQQGQQIEEQSNQAQPSTLPEQGAAARRQFDDLASRFKQISAATLPLSHEITLLDQCHSNLMEWHDSISRESARLLRSVLINVAIVAIAIFIILLLSEIWRRITFRYIRDVRRRRQFLLIRRIVVSFCLGMVLILGFVSEFSSLATFAGFITAGLAVGLQTILLSVAAYFFLVGRWGIRVGDRITVGGVTGDVVDSGLVRFYLMELAGTGVDLYPTGRVAVFANSILFQPTTPLFKQLPGSEYTWHEVAIALKPDVNYKLAEEQLLAAVNSVYADYREDFARQHSDVERRIDVPLNKPEPHAQLHSSDTGLEYVIRYPVPLRGEAEMDGKVMRKVLEAADGQPDLKATLSGAPKIRAAIKV